MHLLEYNSVSLDQLAYCRMKKKKKRKLTATPSVSSFYCKMRVIVSAVSAHVIVKPK